MLVEGRDDKLFFEQFVSADNCVVKVVEGRDTVAEVVDILVLSEFRGVLGVVDGDAIYSRDICVNGNLILLECLDLEALLIRFGSLDRILIEFGSGKKLKNLPCHAWKILVKAAKPIGCLRIRSALDGLSLRFDGLRYSRFVDLKTLEVDHHSLVQEVKHRSKCAEIECRPVLEGIAKTERVMVDDWSVCLGEDLVAILSIGLRRVLGTNNAGAVSPEILRRSLRLAFSKGDLEQTRLHDDILRWTSRNRDFRVL